MYFGKVIGNVWATKKYEALFSLKMMIVQPISAEQENLGEPIIAVDTVGAGPEKLLFTLLQAKRSFHFRSISPRWMLQLLELLTL